MTFRYVELFAGIGGFSFGLKEVGGNCVMASEWDKFAKNSYQILHPDVDLRDDVTKIGAEEVPEHDVLVFGMPCQAFSVAGKRLGFEDMRGTLYFEAMRIAKEKKPKVLWMENVKGLVSHDKGRTLDVMVQAMSDIGYTVDFEVLNSKYFGVPQNRERIFLIGVRNDLLETAEWETGKRTDVVAKGKRRIAQLGVNTFNFDWPAQEEVTVRLRDILESNVDERYYLSEEKTAKLVAQLDEKTEGLAIKEATTKGYAVAAEGDAVNFQFPDSKTRRGRVGKQIAQTLEASGINQGVVDYSRKDGIGKEREVALCLSSSDWRGLNRNQKQNAVLEEVRPVLTPDRIEKRQNGRRFKDNDEEAFTLTAQDRHGVAMSVKSLGNTNPSGNGMNGQVYDINAGLSPTLTTNKGEGIKVTEAPRYRIRKLTPLECWRLQGFSDEAHETVKSAGISDSQRYKQAGNAVTVNVISAIGRRLLPYL